MKLFFLKTFCASIGASCTLFLYFFLHHVISSVGQLIWGAKNHFKVLQYLYVNCVISNMSTGWKYKLIQGSWNHFEFFKCLWVHCMILNILPLSHFLHDTHYLKQQKLDSLLTSVPMIGTRHEAVRVIFFCHAHIYFPSSCFLPTISVDTHNIASI